MLNFLLLFKNLKFFVDLTIGSLISYCMPNYVEYCCVYKVSDKYSSNAITTFILFPLLSLKAVCFSLIFLICQTMYVTGTS